MISVNPYRPGAGMTPAFLAGREQTLQASKRLLETVQVGFPARSVIFYGLRGVGKTVLLNHIESMADEMGLPSEYMEIAEREYSFQQHLSLYVYKLINKLSLRENVQNHVKKALSILKAFSVKYSDGTGSLEINVEPAQGISDTGDLSNDMTELLLSLGTVAQKEEKGVVLFLDEVQYMKEAELEAFMTALHRLNQKGLPVVVFAAGLPKIAKITGDVKSYAERLFDFVEIGSLSETDAAMALTEPARRLHVSYDSQAVAYMISITEGYPYFLQEYGKWSWETAADGASIITLATVKEAYEAFEKSLDASFFKVRHDRATSRELAFMLAMVQCQELPCSTKEIASIMNETAQGISPLRAQLIHKGFIYAAKRGTVDFTVLQFDRYLRRMHGAAEIE